MSDEEIERSFLWDSEKYFQLVYDRYSGPLFRFLYRFTGNNQASEEILHDIFIELFAGKFSFSESGGLKSWLFTVAKNRGLNHRKKALRETKQDLSLVPSEENLEQNTMQLGLLSHLAKIERHLPHDLKETWDLRKNGLGYAEIAETLSVPVGTVKSRFSRLVEFLRQEFKNEC